MYFPQLLSRYKRIEITIKIKEHFIKRLLSLRFLSLSLEKKSVNIFSLLAFRKNPYISTRQTYTGSKFNSRDPACYGLFSFSDTSSSQIITKGPSREQ